LGPSRASRCEGKPDREGAAHDKELDPASPDELNKSRRSPLSSTATEMLLSGAVPVLLQTGQIEQLLADPAKVINDDVRTYNGKGRLSIEDSFGRIRGAARELRRRYLDRDHEHKPPDKYARTPVPAGAGVSSGASFQERDELSATVRWAEA
jgi:hypothetical protein